VEVRKPFLLTTLAILLAGLVLIGLSDTAISAVDTGVPSRGITSNISGASNSSASATIMITMYAVAEE
jgi:hypothetical protein